ncbi:hypothetical protein BBBOND_0304370 [Babesia bigemina]|uniref:Uncharacterized protein n=1 Tax=Babesia bigemina TaxID=5866 RepID=A0A061D7L2_BABBI|nr:hypothetical protein BBBOND_0304370 [Babesia bigemina]CDR96533.1 hypothetical protein BBBOND_0304370 [Babesia bigemina]|eukprot:XP_012768719.1 hypothetical protein BBBOND_0304370 [Babesia bigemina]
MEHKNSQIQHRTCLKNDNLRCFRAYLNVHVFKIRHEASSKLPIVTTLKMLSKMLKMFHSRLDLKTRPTNRDRIWYSISNHKIGPEA